MAHSGSYQRWKEHITGLTRYLQSQARRRSGGLLCIGVILAISLSALPHAWALQAIPTTLSFQAVQGGASPSSQILNVLKNNSHTVSWSSKDNATWLIVSPTTGSITNSAQISVSVNPAGLAAGTYAATVTVTANQGGSISVPVTFRVTSGSPTGPTATSTSGSVGTVTLSWDPSTATNLAGYKVYKGTASGVYSSPITVGNVTSYTISNLGIGSTYYFAVTEYNTSGLESGFSNEVSKSIY
jgi:hypothetical protein